MNRQHLDIQIEYLRRELTSISQELHYLEGQKARMLRIRQSRLSAELERVQCQRIEMPADRCAHLHSAIPDYRGAFAMTAPVD